MRAQPLQLEQLLVGIKIDEILVELVLDEMLQIMEIQTKHKILEQIEIVKINNNECEAPLPVRMARQVLHRRNKK